MTRQSVPGTLETVSAATPHLLLRRQRSRPLIPAAKRCKPQCWLELDPQLCPPLPRTRSRLPIAAFAARTGASGNTEVSFVSAYSRTATTSASAAERKSVMRRNAGSNYSGFLPVIRSALINRLRPRAPVTAVVETPAGVGCSAATPFWNAAGQETAHARA